MKEITEMRNNSAQCLLRFFADLQKPGRQYFLRQRHAELEILLFTQGTGLFRINNQREYTFQKGDVFLLSTNEDHYTPVIFPGEDMRTIGVRFTPQLIWSPGNDLFDMKYLKVFFNRDENFEHKLDAGTSVTKTIHEHLRGIQKEFEQKLPDYELKIKIFLLTILVDINRTFDHIAETPQVAVKSQQSAQIEQSMLYIDAHIDSEITLDDLAAQANMSRSYFCQTFKTLNGISAWNYIINKRIELAEDLLMNTDDTIIEVAYRCGFNNSTNFNRAFKKVTGLVPSEFRKYWKLKKIT